MSKRARSYVVTEGQGAANPVPQPPPPEVLSTPPQTPEIGAVRSDKLLPITQRLLPYYSQINKKNLVTLAEFNKICLIVAGDERRAIHRLLLAIYQRALIQKEDAEVKRARFMLNLHEANQLLHALELESV